VQQREKFQGNLCELSIANRGRFEISSIRHGTEGDNLEERITRVVLKVLEVKMGEVGLHSASSDVPGPSHAVEDRGKAGAK